jgi:hypothetical protein
VHWLTGYYDEFVDESERRAQARMGLDPVPYQVTDEDLREMRKR